MMYNSEAGYIESYDKNGNIKKVRIGTKKHYIEISKNGLVIFPLVKSKKQLKNNQLTKHI